MPVRARPVAKGDFALATTGYGVGDWHLAAGRRTAALAIFDEIVAGEAWAAFGFLAAEAELARIRSSSIPAADS